MLRQQQKRAIQTAWILLGAVGVCFSEIIPDSRRIDWAPGIEGGIPQITAPVVSVLEYGAAADGQTDDASSFQDAIDALVGGGVAFVPGGTYRLCATINLNSGVVLRGEGYDKTFLEFDFGGQSRDCIVLCTYDRGEWVSVTGGLSKGSTTITVADGSGFSGEQFVEIQQENDAELMYTDPAWNQGWAQNSVGQILPLVSVVGNTLTVARPLYLDFRQELNPLIRSQGFVTNAGVERLHIEKVDSGSEGSIITMKNSALCWVREVESKHASAAHVKLGEAAYGCVVRDSYFHHAYDYGGGGHGYGVSVAAHSTDCLIENNIFRHLRHAMLVALGSCGNVFGYNYSIEPAQGSGEENLNQGWTPCDISMHGHYPFMNLFESNVVQEIDFADYWGPCGPGNTVFRNRVESEGINILDHSHNQNVVGNVLGFAPNVITQDESVSGALIHANTVEGAVVWSADIDDRDLAASYYRSQKPGFFGDLPWPCIGPDITASGLLPAQKRYQDGAFVSIRRGERARYPSGAMPSKSVSSHRIATFSLCGARLDAHGDAFLRSTPSGVYLELLQVGGTKVVRRKVSP